MSRKFKMNHLIRYQQAKMNNINPNKNFNNMINNKIEMTSRTIKTFRVLKSNTKTKTKNNMISNIWINKKIIILKTVTKVPI
jgi:hypothetical protein